jgi:hypothetical protein
LNADQKFGQILGMMFHQISVHFHFFMEIEDNILLVHRKTEAQDTGSVSFSQEKQELRKTRISFGILI